VKPERIKVQDNCLYNTVPWYEWYIEFFMAVVGTIQEDTCGKATWERTVVFVLLILMVLFTPVSVHLMKKYNLHKYGPYQDVFNPRIVATIKLNKLIRGIEDDDEWK
jgi:hypothetical protein